MIEDLWYKNAIIYCLDVETFMDGNGDGVGDFLGLRRRLDYLAGLGVNCLWLLPFYPSPNRDNRYDVSDYYGVDPRLGDLGDFVAFSHQARLHGIRIIVDLVINHTSDQHPWFQASRQEPDSRFRDYYIWSRERPADIHQGLVFPGQQKATWSYDEKAGAWYFHRFFDFQPDLNIANPAVREELFKVMGFWLELGVSGFRLDAVPFLLERVEPHGDGRELRYDFLRELRQFVSWRRGDAVLLAEANVPMDEVLEYFGDGDRMHLVFNFLANQHLFESMASEDARPLARALGRAPSLPLIAQWANFLRNHDELDLGRLSRPRRRRIFEAFGSEPHMQLYERGLRRRLAPMLGGDRRRLELALSLMLSLPGTPVLWYGDELGLGEDLELPGRQSVRTPMQWSSAAHAGFSTAPEVFREPVHRGSFSYERVNVAEQRHAPDSLLNWVERMVRMRKESPEMGWGSWRVLRIGEPSVLALRYDWREGTLVTLHNFSARARSFTLAPLRGDAEPLVDVLSGEHCLAARRGGYRIRLEGYGYRWFRVGSEDEAPGRGRESEA